ncbi:MAG: DUF2796 domain-containing protein [Oceanospirillaceae bacterium]|nr:DUF2796 domain-containing protein [Oceanospirillaceae bacterium]
MDQFKRKSGSIITGSALIGLTLLGSAVQANALEESDGAGGSLAVHQHGVAELNLALDGKHLELELISPAANIIGFEHAARTDAEKQKVQQSIKKLQQAGQLFALTAAADCRLGRVELASTTDTDEHSGEHDNDPEHHAGEHEHEHEHEHDEAGGDHSDLRVHYYYQCLQPKQLNGLDVLMFKAFPAIEKIHLQLITPQTQQGKLLTPDNPRVSF